MTEEHGDMAITHIDYIQRIITAIDLNDETKVKVFQIAPDAKSDRELFNNTVVARWNVLRPNFIDDDDFTDYMPGFYANLDAVKREALEIIE